MIFNSRLIYSISHLSYSSNTIPLLQKFKERGTNPSFNLLNFDHPLNYPYPFTRFFKSKPHAQLFQLYLKFIELGESEPKDITYRSIEKKLRNTALSELKKKQIKIRIQKLKVLQSTLLEQRQFRGVFIHRNLNLSNESYDIKVNRNGSISFDLKKSLRYQSIREYERMAQVYSAENLKDVYCESLDDFQKNKEIKRYLYRLVADLTLSVDQRGNKNVIGQQSPTEHLLQVESVYNRYYQMQEFFLTDVDFILQGNYFLRSRFD